MNLDSFYIAAMLHDIGKFIERTRKYEGLKDGSSWTLSQTQYAHPIYGAEWFRIAAKNIPCLKEKPQEELKEIETLIATHHKPQTLEGKLLQFADWLSSSEREKNEEDRTVSYRKTPLSSIFSSVFDGKVSDYVYLPDVMDFETLFPSKKEDNIDLKELEERFEGDLRNIDKVEKFLPLLERYTWCVPAQMVGYVPDISLYDHLFITAAFAVALWYEKEAGRINESNIDKLLSEVREVEESYFCLLGGDSSGIQDFIFNIPSKGAAKSLKGRSLYVSLLSEVIARYIVKELGLRDANVLYIGGGNFHILLPYSKAEKIEEIRRNVSAVLFKGHANRLYFSLEYVPVSPKDMIKGDLYKIYHELYSRINRRKNQRYLELFDSYELLFSQPERLSPYEGHCRVCGEHRREYMADKDICKMCNSFIKLAEDVKNAKYLSVRDVGGEVDNLHSYKDIFKAFSFDVRFARGTDNSSKNYNLFEFDLRADGIKAGAYRVPDGTFEDIVKTTKREGAELFAYLKIDVDNLGQIFRKGLKKQDISRRATLSRMLKFFFTAYVPYRYQNEKDVYLLYAGGDDAFIMGRWEKILDVATEIRDDFERFVAYNPDITFSAGIFMNKHDFPVIRAANFVEDELENAKNSGKNKVSIFHQAFSWSEFKSVKDLSDRLCNWAYDLKKKSFIHKLEMLSCNMKPLIKDKYSIGKPWQFVYALRGLDKGKLKEIMEIVKKMWLQEGPIDVGKYHIENRAFLYVASRIAELKLRGVEFK